VRDFSTQIPCGLKAQVSMHYSEYKCLMCGDVRVLPQGDWPVGSRAYNIDEVWDKEWDELLEGVEIEDEWGK